MISRARGLIVCAALVLCAALPAFAAPPSTVERTRVGPAEPGIESRVLAATKLADVASTAVYIKVLSVTMFQDQLVTASGADTVIYEMAGTMDISVGGAVKNLKVGEAFVLKAGQKAELKTGKDLSAFVTFNLLTPSNREQTLLSAPAIVTVLYQTAAALPGLQRGRYDMDLTEVTYPPNIAFTPPQQRTGAALSYIVAGIGVSAVGGNPVEVLPGQFVYAPAGLMYQWSNQRPAPMRFVVFNINPEGTPAFVPVKLEKK